MVKRNEAPQEPDLVQIRRADEKYHIGVYGERFFKDILIVEGEGAILYGHDGKKYTDCVAGIASNSLGYKNHALNEVIMGMIEGMGLIHLSNLFYSDVQAKYAEKLCSLLPLDEPKVFFCNSGGEAVNGAIKCASKNKGDVLISMCNSFHGRYGAALAATGQTKYKKGFEKTLPGNVYHIKINNERELEVITSETYAVIIEPIQGEGGIIEASFDYMKALREACDNVGALLIFDEVQTGIGRTGKMFAAEYYSVRPDIICLAKGIAGGIPFGAFAVNRKADLLTKGEHASTFGGNHLACTAGLEVLRQIEENGLLKNAVDLQHRFFEWYEGNSKSDKRFHNNVSRARGKGLMLGLEMKTEEHMSKVIQQCVEDGVLFARSGEKTIRIVPPLVITREQFDKALAVLKGNIVGLK